MRKRRDPLYLVWGAMIQRCHNPRARQFKDYGGRGITVCESWRSYKNFENAVAPRPEGMTIERINNNRGYSPDNVRWATRKEQNSNKRNCIYVVVQHGKRVTLREFCRLRDLPYRAIVKRIQTRGWPLSLALHIPVGNRGGREIFQLWDECEQLRDYLRVALRAAEGAPVTDRLLDEARKLADAGEPLELAA